MRRANLRLVVATLALASLSVLGVEGQVPQPVFPVHANGTHLVDANGVPFPILGRVTWMVTRLPVAEYRAVLDDTAAKGFNSIEIKPPLAPNGFQRDASGNLPFLRRLDGATWNGEVIPYSNVNAQAPDFTTPNEAFWLGVDAFLAYAEQKGLLVFYFPAYVGYANTDWWMEMMVANGSSRMQTYGAWVANRYRTQKNLVWMLGGDKGTGGIPFNSSETAVESALITGLKSVATVSREYSAEWLRGSIAKDLFASSITLNGTYASATDLPNQGARAWAYSPTTPAFVQEYPFEDLSGTGIVRRLTMRAWLSTIGGFLFGNGILTDFAPGQYQSYLNTQGTRDAQRLNDFIRTIPWQTLVPNNNAVTAGNGSSNSETYVSVAANSSLLLAYVPPQHTGSITINMSLMNATTTARWWDPTSGSYASDSSGLPNSGTHTFTPPGNNSAGNADWMLVLTASTATAPAAPSNVRIVVSP